MKTVLFKRYGSPDGLEIGETEKPVPGDREILVRIRASTVTAGDTEIRRLKLSPHLALPIRLYAGLRRPRRIPVLGMEFAGVVEETGAAVTRFKTGDEVFAPTGFGFGAYAEYICVNENGPIAMKPDGVSFEEAATLPIGGTEALTFVNRAKIQTSQQVLVYGGSGSIGSFAIQLANLAGADVTAVGNPSSLELMRLLGATRVLDYTKDDFTTEATTFDVIIDTIGKCPFRRALGKLARDGRYLMANPKLRQTIAGAVVTLVSSRRVISGVAEESASDLEHLAKLVQSGALEVVIDRRYPLEEIVAAHRYVDTGHKTGNVVVTVT